MQSGFVSALLSIAVLGAFALAGGGAWLIARRRERLKGVLMIVCALVLLGNVLVWTV
jgi:LPXTG-motif cell wall-anchored protein